MSMDKIGPCGNEKAIVMTNAILTCSLVFNLGVESGVLYNNNHHHHIPLWSLLHGVWRGHRVEPFFSKAPSQRC